MVATTPTSEAVTGIDAGECETYLHMFTNGDDQPCQCGRWTWEDLRYWNTDGYKTIGIRSGLRSKRDTGSPTPTTPGV